MDAEFTAHMGGPGDILNLHIDWFDHNNRRQKTDVEIKIFPDDKPRTLAISVNGIVLHLAQGV